MALRASVSRLVQNLVRSVLCAQRPERKRVSGVDRSVRGKSQFGVGWHASDACTVQLESREPFVDDLEVLWVTADLVEERVHRLENDRPGSCLKNASRAEGDDELGGADLLVGTAHGSSPSLDRGGGLHLS